MARARTVAGHVVPSIIMFFFWVVVAILAIIVLALIVHWLGGAQLHFKLGHFFLDFGFS